MLYKLLQQKERMQVSKMTNSDYAKRMNEVEDGLIQKFREHHVLSALSSLTNDEFKELLVQRAFLSTRAFTPFCDLASAGLHDEEAKDVVRWLIREEYPANAPSHREDLVTDCVAMGIDKQRLLGVNPTNETDRAIKGLYELVKFEEPHYDIKAVVAVRLAGEALIAEEYGMLLPEMERRYGLSRENSVFYQPHFFHDQKKIKIGQKGASHSDRFSGILIRLVDNDEKLGTALEAFENSYKVKAGFYNQFRK